MVEPLPVQVLTIQFAYGMALRGIISVASQDIPIGLKQWHFHRMDRRLQVGVRITPSDSGIRLTATIFLL